MPKMKAIGLSGFAGSGKSAVAQYLERKYGFKRRHIAEPLRAMLRPLFAAYGIDEETTKVYLEGALKEVVVPEFGVSPREMQITLGTEWGREMICDTLWSGAWRRAVAASDDVTINDSVRFPNEATAIAQLDGIVIRIERPGVGPAKFVSWWGRILFWWCGLLWGAHPSERVDRIIPDYTILNDGSLQDLYAEVDAIMEMEGQTKISGVNAAA